MGCQPSKIEYSQDPPKKLDSLGSFARLPGEPCLPMIFHKQPHEELIRFAVVKTRKDPNGDYFRVKEAHSTSRSGLDWNGEDPILVEPVYRRSLFRSELEGTNCVYQGKEEFVPLAYWTCDIQKGQNHFRILREKPTYAGQQVAYAIKGDDQLESRRSAPSPFVGRTSVDLFSYSSIVFDVREREARVAIFGAPKCAGGRPLYVLKFENARRWVLRRFSSRWHQYRDCAIFEYGTIPRKGLVLGSPLCWYETSVAHGIDLVFVITLGTILDSFYNRMRLQ